MPTLNQTELYKEQLLEVHIELEKLKLVRKEIIKEAAIFVGIAIACFVVGFYAESAEWTEFPVFPGAIFLGSILLALAFRPLQNYKKQLAAAEEKREGLHMLLKKDNLDYTVDVRVSKDSQGEFEVQKSIEIFRAKIEVVSQAIIHS